MAAKTETPPTIEDLEAQRQALALDALEGDQDALESLRRVEAELHGRRVDDDRHQAAERERERREAEKAAEEERKRQERLTRRRKKAARKRREVGEEVQKHLDEIVDLIAETDQLAVDEHNDLPSKIFGASLAETARRRCPGSKTHLTFRRMLVNPGTARRVFSEWEQAATAKWLRGGRS